MGCVWQVVGRERAAPSVREVAAGAAASGDMYRALREQIAALQGVVKVAPVSVGGGQGFVVVLGL